MRKKIDSPRFTEIIRDRTPDDIEGGSNVGGDGLNEVSRSIERKAQGYINLVVTALGDGESERCLLAGPQAS